jgi:glycosyltransferase involved in cell wall biosynthesis
VNSGLADFLVDMSEISPKVSAVIASYNYSEYLPRRIQSLIDQTHQNLEIIIIDDKSQDNSLEVIKDYTSNSKVLLLALEKNVGWIEVSNLGIAKANSDYVLFANCDDYCEPDLVSSLVNELEKNKDAGLAFTSSYLIDEHDNVIGLDLDQRSVNFKRAIRDSNILEKKILRHLLLESCVMPNLSCVLFRKDVFERIGIFSKNYEICSDWDLFLRLANEYSAVYLVSPKNYFRQHNKTVRASHKRTKMSMEMFEIVSTQIAKIQLNFTSRLKLKFRLCYSISAELLTPLKGFDIKEFFYLQKAIKSWDYRLFIFPAYIFFAIRMLLIEFKRKITSTINKKNNHRNSGRQYDN